MKKIFKLYFVLLAFTVISLSSCSGNKLLGQGQSGASISYQTFYDDLSPYGSWIDYPAYGQVWHPNVSGGFRPYLTNGYWDYSTDGWMWMSNYNWGWAPFHYGRWVYDDMYGWLWIPGYEWSPAWVTWGMFEDNYAWAPLMPGINVGISFRFYRPSSFYWNAVRRDHIYDRDIYRRTIPRDKIINNISDITVINNFGNTRNHNQYYSRGPEINEVEKYTKRTITPAIIGERKVAGSARREGNQLQVYRPAVTTPLPREFRKIDRDQVQPLVGNEGQTTKGSEQPARENVLPATGNENTIRRNEVPVRENEAPSSGKENTIQSNEVPVRENLVPATGNENPVKVNEAPARKILVPATGNENPVKVNEAPARKNLVPATGNKNTVKRNEVPVNPQNNPSPRRLRPLPGNNVNQPRPAYRNESELRNNEVEQRRNIEKLPVVRAPQSTFGHMGGHQGGGNKHR